MPSLYDKLNAMGPKKEPKKPSAPAPDMLRAAQACPLDAGMLQPVTGSELALLGSGDFADEYAPGEFLFLDTETTGLSTGAGTVAFLVGIGKIEDDQLVVTQVLMRDYDQEGALLQAVLDEAASSRCLVTYNGASFDLPLLRSRLTMHRMRGLSEIAHVDLLYATRRVFRLRLGSCSLTRVEEEVFGEKREGDLPGADVPGRYFEYLEKRDERLLQDVLTHNRQDIVSLARLFLTVLRLMKDPTSSPHQEDLFSIGKALEKRGLLSRAETCYRACADRRLAGDAGLRLAEIYRRGRRDEEAAQALEALRNGPHASAKLYISLAKLYEHRFSLTGRALDTARQGMIYCSERLGTPAFDADAYHDLARRVRRLTGKAEKAKHDN